MCQSGRYALNLPWRTVVRHFVGMAPKKNDGHIKSAQMTRSNVYVRLGIISGITEYFHEQRDC